MNSDPNIWIWIHLRSDLNQLFFYFIIFLLSGLKVFIVPCSLRDDRPHSALKHLQVHIKNLRWTHWKVCWCVSRETSSSSLCPLCPPGSSRTCLRSFWRNRTWCLLYSPLNKELNMKQTCVFALPRKLNKIKSLLIIKTNPWSGAAGRVVLRCLCTAAVCDVC